MLESFRQATSNPISFLLFLFAVLGFAYAIRLFYLLQQREKKADERLKQARADITDMTILFQTMRDIIGQQKTLAKEFNAELEHKMGQVKHILSQGMEKNKQLYEKQQRIAADLEESQQKIDAIFRQLDAVPPRRSNPTSTVKPAAEPRRPEDILPSSPLTAPRPIHAKATNGTTHSRPLRTAEAIAPPTSPTRPRPAVPPTPKPVEATRKPVPAPTKPPLRPETPKEELIDTGVTNASFSSWIAEDFSELRDVKPQADAKHSAAPTPDPEPQIDAESRNGDAARDAFRALLNMPQQDIPDRPPLDLPGQMASLVASTPAPENTEENSSSRTMQKRVLEYSDAGMTVAEVSRELGIGKGEVRLMLSLAKQASPPTP